jgi:hypothetical protein
MDITRFSAAARVSVEFLDRLNRASIVMLEETGSCRARSRRASRAGSPN